MPAYKKSFSRRISRQRSRKDALAGGTLIARHRLCRRKHLRRLLSGNSHVVVVVRIDPDGFEYKAGEKAVAARIGKDLCLHLRIRSRTGRWSDRPGRDT